MTFFDELMSRTAAERKTLLALPILARATRGEVDLATYRAFLTEAYHHVKHTVPLLMACGARLPASQEWLREAVGEYIAEEMGHQEWILNDLAACGADPEAVRHGTPGFATELMVAYAWDTVQRGRAIGFFGMVLVLEGTSIALALQAAEALRESLRLPVRAFSYLSSHGVADERHMRFFQDLMNRVSDPGDQAAIVHVARRMYRLYADVFRSLDGATSEREAA